MNKKPNKENYLLDESYRCDVDIVSINFYGFDDPINENPRIIIGCKTAMFDENGFTHYKYFNLNFINPSRYLINIKTFPFNISKEELANPQKTYCPNYPFTYNIVEVETSINHTHWEIQFGERIGFKDDEFSIISIYADNLIVKDIDNPYK